MYDLFFIEKELSDSVKKASQMEDDELILQAKELQPYDTLQMYITRRIIASVKLTEKQAADLCKNAIDPRLRKYAVNLLSM